MVRLRSPAPFFGEIPEWPKGADCKSVVNDFGGSNPPPSTRKALNYNLFKAFLLNFFDI